MKNKNNTVSEWSKLEEIATPNEWLKIYGQYEEMLEQVDTGSWYAEQLQKANIEREKLRKEIDELKAAQVAKKEELNKVASFVKRHKLDIQEVWDEYSEHIDDDIFHLERYAGTSVITRSQFEKFMKKYNNES